MSEDEQLALALAASASDATQPSAPAPHPAPGGPDRGQGHAAPLLQTTHAEAALDDDAQLALALSLSMGETDDVGGSAYAASGDYEAAHAGGAGGGAADLATDLDDDARLARELAAQFEAEERAGVASHPAGGDGASAAMAAPSASGHGAATGQGDAGAAMRVQVLGAAAAGGERGGAPHVVYRIQLVLPGGLSGGAALLKRFSAFVELVSQLGKELGGAGEGDQRGTAVAVVDTWKWHLAREKRHTGKASRSEAVVNGRCALLQRMMDELCAAPAAASSIALATFLAGQ